MNLDQIEIHVGIPDFEYEPLRALEARSEARWAFSAPPTEEDVNVQLRRLAASVAGDAVVGVQYKLGAGMFSWKVLKATGLAVRKGRSATPPPFVQKPLKSTDHNSRLALIIAWIVLLFIALFVVE